MPEAPKPIGGTIPNVSRDTLAGVFGVSPRSITYWCDEGMPRVRRGTFDVAACVQWRLSTLMQRDQGTSDEERRALVRAQTERTQLEASRLRGTLIDADLVHRTLMQLGTLVASQLDGLAGRAAAEVAAMSDTLQVQTYLLAECRSIRTSIADLIAGFAVEQHGPGDA